ncbi:unnamed protein product, partial [Symbiodinium sp. KB8]
MRFLSLGLFLSLGGTDFLLAPRLTLFGPRLAEPLQQRGSNHQLIWPLFDALGGQIRFGKAYRAEALGNLLSGGFSTYLLSLAGIAVSRRLCNLPYVLHILSLNACVLAWLAYADLAAERPRPEAPSLADSLAAVSESMLAVFLFANLLTGFPYRS